MGSPPGVVGHFRVGPLGRARSPDEGPHQDYQNDQQNAEPDEPARVDRLQLLFLLALVLLLPLDLVLALFSVVLVVLFFVVHRSSCGRESGVSTSTRSGTETA